MERVRVYHPETNEPFDVTPSRADVLRLEKGWLSQPFTKVEVAHTTQENPPIDWRLQGEGDDESQDDSDGEAPEGDAEVQEDEAPAPTGRGRRRRAAED
jgi:hypothetical protein